MVYQATQRIHFAQGETATFSTYIAWPLMEHGYGYWSAFSITLAVSFIGGAAIQRLLLTRKTPGPALIHIMFYRFTDALQYALRLALRTHH